MAQTIIEIVRDETKTELPGTFHMSRDDPSASATGIEPMRTGGRIGIIGANGEKQEGQRAGRGGNQGRRIRRRSMGRHTSPDRIRETVRDFIAAPMA